jgi:DMSO/TMAO reductase YedYZ molybdopterin-dependent catalytic subunit
VPTTTKPSTGHRGETAATPRRRWLLGGTAGLLAGAAAVAASEAVAVLLTGVTSPLLAVGNRAIDATPRPLKELAIRTLGENDKPVLLGGVVVTVALLAALAGVVGVRRPRVALGAFLVLSLAATVVGLTDRTATGSPVLRLLPALALVAVGAPALLLLLRTLRTPPRSSPPAGSGGASTAPTGSGGSAALSDGTPETLTSRRPPATRGENLVRVEKVESEEHGKPRILVREVLPAHVDGDDLPAWFDRRGFLQAAAAAGAVVVAGGAVRQAFGGSAAAGQRADLSLPGPATPAPALGSGTSLDVPGITPYLTSTEEFYRVDTALRVPDVPIDGYTLRIHGMVEKELELSFADLLKRRMMARRITLTCVSNPVGGKYAGNATWLGVPVRDLLDEAGVKDGADAVKSTSADDMTIGTPLAALTDPNRDALVAVGMNGQPLPLAHGFPVRMVVPGLYGYVSATKWLVDLEVTRFADFKAYWSTRGYSVKAPIKTSSRIDVPRSFAQVRAGTQVPVAGVAWSQDRGIEKVEVRVDGGPWQEARLADQDNIDTWRQWMWLWDAKSGNHQIEVRATDTTGYVQTDKRTPIAPNGSTGWHSVSVTAH